MLQPRIAMVGPTPTHRVLAVLAIVTSLAASGRYALAEEPVGAVGTAPGSAAPGNSGLGAGSGHLKQQSTPRKAGYLTGRVSVTPSPLLFGSAVEIPAGSKIDLNVLTNLNSEISQPGDRVLARISMDVKDGARLLLPGGWYLSGAVTDIASQRRLGRDGFVEVEFDKLLSPQGDIQLPFKARFSSRDHELKAVAKSFAIDSAYVASGAFGGALASVQLTGIPVAIASHGYSVAIGAGVGATIGAVGALKRKGKILSIYPGDQIRLTLPEPITMPGFDPALVPSARSSPQLRNLLVSVNKAQFKKDPFGDAHSRLLTIDLELANHTRRAYSFFDLAVVSDHNQRFYPLLAGDFRVWNRKVLPDSSQQATISFSVDSPKHKYWLVLLDRCNREELTRVPIN